MYVCVFVVHDKEEEFMWPYACVYIYLCVCARKRVCVCVHILFSLFSLIIATY